MNTDTLDAANRISRNIDALEVAIEHSQANRSTCVVTFPRLHGHDAAVRLTHAAEAAVRFIVIADLQAQLQVQRAGLAAL